MIYVVILQIIILTVALGGLYELRERLVKLEEFNRKELPLIITTEGTTLHGEVVKIAYRGRAATKREAKNHRRKKPEERR